MTTVTAAVYAIAHKPATGTLAADMRTIESTRRSTKTNPVDEKDRYRAIQQPASILAVPTAECATRFYQLLQASIDSLAVAKLAQFTKEQPAATEVPADQFTMAAILTFASETAASQQIDGPKIAEWFKTSATYAALKATSEQLAASWLAKLPKIGAPNYRGAGVFNANSCASIVAKMHQDDMDSPIAAFIMTRCNIIIEESNADAF